MISFKQFLIEANAPFSAPILDMKAGSFFPALSGEGGGADVTVMNPKGAAFNTTTKPTLGMGFEMAPNIAGTVQNFVDKYSDKNTNNVNKPTNSKTPATKTPVTWQTTNQAVSNQQKEELNKLLAKFNLTPNEPKAPPPLTKQPPPIPSGGVPVRGQLPGPSEETQAQFQARWEEYMRLLRLNQQWDRQERERERRERERQRNPNDGLETNNGQSSNNGQSPNLVQTPKNTPTAIPPLTERPPPVPDGGYPVRGQYPAKEGETQEQFAARWAEYMRLLELNQRWAREQRERERQRQRNQDNGLATNNGQSSNNGQSPNFVQDPDFVGPPSPEPEIFGPPNPDSITPNGDGSYTLPDWWPHQWQRDPMNSPEPEIFGPPNPDSITPNGDGSYTLPDWWPQQFATPGQQQGTPGLLSMNNKPGSKPSAQLSPQKRLRDKINNIKN